MRECLRVMRQNYYRQQLLAGKTAAKDIEMKAIYVGETVAIDAGKKLDGPSVNRPTASNAITIQDVVRRINGSGLKVTKFFFLPLQIMADIYLP